MLPTPPVAPVTRTSPRSFVRPRRSSAITQSIAVKPAVPMVIASRVVMPSGRRTSQSPRRRAFCARQPQWLSPTPQPFRIARSPGFQSGWALSSITPAPSMPAIIGHLRTMGDLSVMASASL